MSKYKIFKNKRTKYHPSIEICILEDGTWENIEITDSPTATGCYEELDINPNPNSNKKSYFRKYLRKDKLRHRGAELKKYHLVVSDEVKINVYVSLIKEQRKNGGKLMNKALSRKGHTPSTSIKTRKHKKGKRKWKKRWVSIVPFVVTQTQYILEFEIIIHIAENAFLLEGKKSTNQSRHQRMRIINSITDYQKSKKNYPNN